MNPKIPADEQPEHFPTIRYATRARIVFADGTVYEDPNPFSGEVRIDDPELRPLLPPED